MHILELKLDKECIKHWSKHQKGSTEIAKLDEFLEFLKLRITILERSEKSVIEPKIDENTAIKATQYSGGKMVEKVDVNQAEGEKKYKNERRSMNTEKSEHRHKQEKKSDQCTKNQISASKKLRSDFLDIQRKEDEKQNEKFKITARIMRVVYFDIRKNSPYDGLATLNR